MRASVAPSLVTVLGAVAEDEARTASEVLVVLGLPWALRGTVRNRLYELERAGLVIADDNRPLRFLRPYVAVV